MVNYNKTMPVKDLSENSLANTKHRWQHGEEWFEYARNSDGYRSEEFQTSPSFLFAGCSETFGESSEYETTWAYKLFNKIKKDGDSYCNLGLPGIDVSLIINNIMIFIDKYGKPKNLFVIFPGFNRIVENDSIEYTTATFFPNTEKKEVEFGNISYTSKRIMDILYSVNLLQIKNLEMFCKHLNINLKWSSWDLESNKKIIKFNAFDNYIDITDYKDITDHAIDLGYDHKTLRLTRADGSHHGEIFHDYWANVFYYKYEEDKR